MTHWHSSWSIRLAAAALLAAGLACNTVSNLTNGAGATPTARPTRTPADDPIEEPTAEEEPTEAEEPTAEPTEEEPTEEPTEEETAEEEPTAEIEATLEPLLGDVLFQDDFSEDVNGWDIDSSDTAARDLRDGVYSLQVFNTVWFAWANPEAPESQDLTDIHLQVSVSNVGGNDPAFGVICSYLNSDAFYFLGFGDDGYYGIARIEGDDFVLLTGDGDTWASSDDIALFEDSYTLEADCRADGRLRLIVDGVVIDEVQDADPYGAGGIGFFVQSFDNVPVDVEFDDLVVTQLTAE